MWTRSQLKEKGKFAFKRNYWKTVLVALLAAGILGGSGGSFNYNLNSDTISKFTNNTTNNMGVDPGFTFGNQFFYNVNPAILGVAIITFIIVALVVAAIAITVKVLLVNPLEMGTKRFFFFNLNQQAEVKEVAFGFDRFYKNIVKTMFFRDLYIFLWSLLFVIPGIIKAYEYRMIPYLLAEYPDMPMEQAFETSKRMMMGQKWKTFVLDLSFIGWYLLAAITMGLVAVFYSAPYQFSTNAALYEALKYSSNAGFMNETGVDNGIHDINC